MYNNACIENATISVRKNVTNSSNKNVVFNYRWVTKSVTRKGVKNINNDVIMKLKLRSVLMTQVVNALNSNKISY